MVIKRSVVKKAVSEANLNQLIQMEMFKWYEGKDKRHESTDDVAGRIIKKVREIETVSLSISIKNDVIEKLGDIIELWFGVHAKMDKSFKTDDFVKFVKEKLK